MPVATDAQVSYSWPLVSVGSVSDNPSSADQTVFNLGLFESADAEPMDTEANCIREVTADKQAVNPELTNCFRNNIFWEACWVS